MEDFREWLQQSYNYTDRTVSNTISRVRRANKILKIHNDEVYIFELEQEPEFKCLSTSVKSQIKRAVRLFNEYKSSLYTNKRMKVLSLYANIGVAEAYLSDIGFDVVVANELDARRAELYKKIYPSTEMICGDINSASIFNDIVTESKKQDIDIVFATPPCQGMSMAGSLKKHDERNYLFLPVLRILKELKPKYTLIENVPLFINTIVRHNKKNMTIPEVIQLEVGDIYDIRIYTIDTKDYSVPQSRERAILLLTKKHSGLKTWTMPEKDKKIRTMRDAIGYLPKLDPFISDVEERELLEIFPAFYKRKEKALEISKWHNPPSHIKRQVDAMMHTPTGETAFNNKTHYPKKKNGERVKGFFNTYKRQNWDTPAYTVTMDNRKISSQNNVHPGRIEKIDVDGSTIYSDARVLTLYEIMKIMTLPDDWPLPDDISEAFVRRVIGEGIPPLFIKKLFTVLRDKNE